MRTESLRQELSRRPLLGDGATGTQLQQMGLAPGACGERWNLDHPERVRELHRRYLTAGSDLLTTNSFGGTTTVLAGHGLEASAHAINVAAARLAREVAGEQAWILGDMGPFGGLLEPLGEVSPDTAAAAFRQQAVALLEGGADALLVETMSDPVEVEIAVGAAREAGAAVVIATYAFQKSAVGYRTMMGTSAAEAVTRALAAGATVVGANCGTDLSLRDYERLTVELVAAAGNAPVIVQPNAGSPVLREGKICYAESAAEFATAATRFLAAGARIVGGCCGSTPEHIAAMRSVMER